MKRDIYSNFYSRLCLFTKIVIVIIEYLEKQKMNSTEYNLIIMFGAYSFHICSGSSVGRAPAF